MLVNRSKQSGFSIIEALLILVAVSILSFTGWYVYHAKQASDKDYSAVTNSTIPTYKEKTDTKANPYADWNTYCSTTGGMCFKYPANWRRWELAGRAHGQAGRLDVIQWKAEQTGQLTGIENGRPDRDGDRAVRIRAATTRQGKMRRTSADPGPSRTRMEL